MKFISHITFPSGVVRRVEVRAANRVEASRAALIGMPHRSTASSRPAAHTQMAIDALERLVSIPAGDAATRSEAR